MRAINLPVEKFTPLFETVIIKKELTLQEALQNLKNSGLLILCFVAPGTNKFLGIMTDSDIRTAFLSGATLQEKTSKWINKNPVTASEILSTTELTELCHRVGKREIPILNYHGEIVDIFVLGLFDKKISIHNEEKQILEKNFSASKHKQLPNFMFIQAGGLGSRLRSIVNDKPKPLAVVGGKPIIDTLIHCASDYGINNFYVSINYLGEQIESFLSSERFHKFNINFIKESKFLGTAGSIGHIAKKLTDPLIICNADILSKIQFHKIIEHHYKNNADITVVLRPYEVKIPYGVVEVLNNRLYSVNEKPQLDFMVSAGIYVISPAMCHEIKENEYLDMPDFISRQIANGKAVVPYYSYEYCIDIGKPDDYYKANEDYQFHFMSTLDEEQKKIR